MYLNIDDIKKITLGALRVYEEDGYFTFSRFSEGQMEKLIKRGENVFLRAICTSNIKIEFYTKGGEISFDYEITKGINREFYSVDLLLDGVYKYSISKDKNEDLGTFKYSVPESEKEQKVTIYFPTTVCLKLKNLSLPDDFTPHRRSKKILTLGDSLLQGYNPNHFQNTAMNIVADFFDSNMINQAIGGDCFLKDNIEKVDFTPDFILVSYGLNDWVSGNFKNGEDCEEYLEKLSELYPETPVFLILPPRNNYLEETRKNDDLLFDAVNNVTITMDDVRAIITEKAKRHKNITVVNARDFVPQYPEHFYSDNVHLTDSGNSVYGNKIANEIDIFRKG